MDLNLVLFSAFSLGIAGSLHCLGMCGPLVLTLPVKNGKGRMPKMLLYLTFKALAYAVIGLFVGLLGMGFFLLKWQQALSIFSGIFILLFVLLPYMHKFTAKFPFQSLFSKVIKSMQTQAYWYHYALLGFLNGFLPCGLVYTALATALVAGSAWNGALAMFTFGLGTIPALFFLSIFKSKLTPARQKFFKPIAITLTVLVAFALILRGMNLGIPYISPHLTPEGKVKSCCH